MPLVAALDATDPKDDAHFSLTVALAGIPNDGGVPIHRDTIHDLACQRSMAACTSRKDLCPSSLENRSQKVSIPGWHLGARFCFLLRVSGGTNV